MVDPKCSIFHHNDCRSITNDNVSAGSVNAHTSDGSAIEIPSYSNNAENSARPINSKITTVTQATLVLNNISQETSANFKFCSGNQQELYVCNKEFMSHDEERGLSEAVGGLEISTQSSGSFIPHRDVREIDQTESLDDSELFEPEIELIKDDVTCPALHSLECKKNPGHFAYFPTNILNLAQIPSKTRHTDVLKFIQLFANLTVRIIVTNKTQQKIGTGSLSLTQNLEDEFNTGEEAATHRFGKAVRCVTSFVKKPKFMIHIVTNKHTVSSNEEAVNAAVEFFYDHPSRNHIKVIKGVRVHLSQIIGDNQSTLVCKTSDQSFALRIYQMRQDVLDIANKLPRRAKECMTKKLFIISHPHGKEKVLSYGDSVLVKYDISSIELNGLLVTKLIKLNNSQVADAHFASLRKAFLYAADTCVGCCGAPVISFKRVRHQASAGADLQLEVWVHNGVEKSHGLGASALKEFTTEDLECSNPSLVGDQAVESDDEEENPGGQAEVTSPVFKVKSQPSYPSYIIYTERLNSFASWDSHHIHRPESLAHAGFFYAGYADCVRCFQCGLGLRSWKEGDDVNAQHEKHRPSCAFLQAHLRPSLHSDQSNSRLSAENDSGRRNLVLTVLEQENEKLQQKLMCKVCDQEPVGDLFLPCGELYACTECSKLLTHCPACNKQILATVATYFG